jgi:hypothetical protein
VGVRPDFLEALFDVGHVGACPGLVATVGTPFSRWRRCFDYSFLFAASLDSGCSFEGSRNARIDSLNITRFSSLTSFVIRTDMYFLCLARNFYAFVSVLSFVNLAHKDYNGGVTDGLYARVRALSQNCLLYRTFGFFF